MLYCLWSSHGNTQEIGIKKHIETSNIHIKNRKKNNVECLFVFNDESSISSHKVTPIDDSPNMDRNNVEKWRREWQRERSLNALCINRRPVIDKSRRRRFEVSSEHKKQKKLHFTSIGDHDDTKTNSTHWIELNSKCVCVSGVQNVTNSPTKTIQLLRANTLFSAFSVSGLWFGILFCRSSIAIFFFASSSRLFYFFFFETMFPLTLCPIKWWLMFVACFLIHFSFAPNLSFLILFSISQFPNGSATKVKQTRKR